MKLWDKIFTFSFTFILGIGFGFGVYHLRVLDLAAANAKTRWLLCSIHQSALRERAEQYHQKFGSWPTNVQELVETHFLPEFSEVHTCPSQVGALTRSDYDGSAWVDENQTGLVACYTASPYRFRIEGSNFTVICSFDREHNQ